MLKMIGTVNERIPHSVKKIVKANLCYDAGKQIGHNWGSVFLFEDYTVIRFFGFSQPPPPHLLPKFVLERLGIIEIF